MWVWVVGGDGAESARLPMQGSRHGKEKLRRRVCACDEARSLMKDGYILGLRTRPLSTTSPPSVASMATLRAPSASFLSAFLPVVRATLLPETSAPITRRIPLLQHLRTNLLPAALLPIPTLIGELWDGLLRAVPKKKTSHMKKRHRQMAGKALRDVTALNKCSACGRAKRAHVLCPYCVQSMCTTFSGQSGLKACGLLTW